MAEVLSRLFFGGFVRRHVMYHPAQELISGVEIVAGIAIGPVIALEALFAGPISGASMNPARSFAPALVSWRLDSLWVYLTAPILGACAGVLACRCVQEPGCCCPVVTLSKEACS